MAFDMHHSDLLSAGDVHNPSIVSSQCGQCPVQAQCLASGSSAAVLSRWQQAARPGPDLRDSGNILHTAGDAVHHIYIVRSGCLKIYTVDSDGQERVRDFHLPGDIIGLDAALDGGVHRVTAAAVTPSQVCALPQREVLALLEQSPLLARRVLQRLSHALAEAQSLAGDYTADTRVAAFLLQMQLRLPRPPSGALQLPMTRRDIANYLRLATETVSRVLTRFAAEGLIRSDRQRIHLTDPAALQRLAAPLCAPAATTHEHRLAA